MRAWKDGPSASWVALTEITGLVGETFKEADFGSDIKRKTLSEPGLP